MQPRLPAEIRGFGVHEIRVKLRSRMRGPIGLCEVNDVTLDLQLQLAHTPSGLRRGSATTTAQPKDPTYRGHASPELSGCKCSYRPAALRCCLKTVKAWGAETSGFCTPSALNSKRDKINDRIKPRKPSNSEGLVSLTSKTRPEHQTHQHLNAHLLNPNFTLTPIDPSTATSSSTRKRS